MILQTHVGEETFWIFRFPFLFIGMWLSISFVLSRFGWAKFARRYSCGLRPEGDYFSVSMLSFGTFGPYYNGVVRVLPTREGLYFYCSILYRAFHEPFLIPWSSVYKIKFLNGIFRKRYEIHIKTDTGAFKLWVKKDFKVVIDHYLPSLVLS